MKDNHKKVAFIFACLIVVVVCGYAVYLNMQPKKYLDNSNLLISCQHDPDCMLIDESLSCPKAINIKNSQGNIQKYLRNNQSLNEIIDCHGGPRKPVCNNKVCDLSK